METTREVINTNKKNLEAKSVVQLERLLKAVLRERQGLDPASPDYAQSLEAEGRLKNALNVAREIERGLAF